ncbi:MAG: PQQ-binding-like beta-propeller repeat protein [Anaerolineae bacterium]
MADEQLLFVDDEVHVERSGTGYSNIWISPEYYENPAVARADEERMIAWHNTVLTDETGNITGTLSSGEDITERKPAEEAKQLVDSRCKHCIQVVGGRVVVRSVDQVLQALDVTTGQAIWQIRLNDDSAPTSRLGSVGFALAGQQLLVIDGTEGASHIKELAIYNTLDGTAVRRISPACADAGTSRSDRRLDWQSPVLVDGRNNRVYTVIE